MCLESGIKFIGLFWLSKAKTTNTRARTRTRTHHFPEDDLTGTKRLAAVSILLPLYTGDRIVVDENQADPTGISFTFSDHESISNQNSSVYF